MAKKSFEKIVIACLLINIVTIVSIIALKKSLPPIVPLFYGLPVSDEQLTSNLGLTIPPLVSIVLILINFAISKFTKDDFLKKIFSGLIISITAFSVVAVIKTILLVGSF